jgi:cell division protease FtsH
MLGGRAAEDVIYGDLSTGAQNDLQQATGLARRMVTEFGMSPLGPIAFDDVDGREQTTPTLGNVRAWSERTAEVIDAEVRAIIEQNYDRARTLLQGKRALMEELAAELKEREEIRGDEVRQRIEPARAPMAMAAMSL